MRAYRDVRLPSPPWNLRGLGEGQTKSRNILTRCVHGQWIDFRHAMYMVSGEVMSLAYQRRTQLAGRRILRWEDHQAVVAIL